MLQLFALLFKFYTVSQLFGIGVEHSFICSEVW